MDIRYSDTEKDGFHGAYYPCPGGSRSAFIYMLGPSVAGLLAKTGVMWLHELGCNVLALAPPPDARGFHDIPVESFSSAVTWLQREGNVRTGICGGSATASLALTAASHEPRISLTLAMTPCDFVMEGYYRDGLDGAGERPADGRSVVTCGGKTIPYLPYAYRHPEYWRKMKEEARAGGNMIASREMFDLSEKLHPLTEDEYIKVEDIKGTLIFAGAEDDCLWDTCRYIRRMRQRLKEHGSECRCEAYIYRHATHFIFPESMLRKKLHCLSGLPVMMFREGRRHRRECRESRRDFDRRIRNVILEWKNA